MSTSFNEQFDQHGAWRRGFGLRLKLLAEWMKDHELLDAGVEERLRRLEIQVRADKVMVAFVGEFSRGKSELINAIFFAGYGRRIMPASAGRTTMCPTEMGYDADVPPCLRLLPIETRLQPQALMEWRMAPEKWTRVDLDVNNPQVWDDWYAYCSRMGATLKLCDGAITTNEFLAAKIRDFSGLPVAVVPNFMNREQLELSERVFAAKQDQQPGADGLIHLGYFSGSPSHNRDFALIIPALEELLEEDLNLGLVVVGYIEAGPRLERFGKRVTRHHFQDYVNLQKLVGSVEINLMPLQFNVFTNSKSELKYFEAAAVGTISVASPSLVYARTIRHGDNGYLAQCHQWTDVIGEAVQQLGSPDMPLRGRADALSRYTGAQQLDCIRAALGLE